ncbi:aspartate kinase [Staphylococcus pseudintermedius]|uniref:aspartate kinase n=1 Tax=Staphylococcus pseudintermedius TaxID=283734 RepID=UPI00129E24A3|nr:aspartate kinase [Staphylococcus pseudintermedius]EGQ2688696.1 aspartate kinase [Staphylococcus pseudintermedius]EGQ2797621.1 aspartate kinase [Staphylococcus pseudintermedius]EGQ2936350.1 aspartate kinase [Staphylococcus pseudintermedius]EGQ3884761.1 aspartate kinase [Staphylococcus pseudintermedius]EGQ3974553.1 aspartate kinase [Staphylococcus pseudintermedius]
MKVSKFGGSSVASAEQIKKVLNIVNSDSERRIIIVSAPGKRYSDDVKTTDLLIRLYEKVINQLDYTHKKQEILNRFKDIIDELPLETDILTEIDRTLESHIATLKDTPERLLDALKSSGENFNAQIIAAYNNEQGVPTIYLSPQDAGIIVTDDPGNAQILESSYDKIKEIRNNDKKIIIPGFFGYSETEHIVTFPRGGSDITGAIVARGVKADLYENFTDVSGIFRANPSVIKHPEVIHKITYREMRELSYAGFGVFHDEALQPLYRYRIPVVIKNTNRPSDKGTYIVHDREINHDKVVSGISCDKGFTSINIKKYLMNRQVGFTVKVLEILAKYNISFDHMPSGIDNISIIMRSNQLAGKEQKVLEEIRHYCQIDELNVEHDLAILMIVGEGMSSTVGTANKITDALAQANINLKMMNQGSSEISMMFGISTKDAEAAVKACYEHCYKR